MDIKKVDQHIDMISIWCDCCENGSLEEFLKFAKWYNIFQEPRTSIYRQMCDKIKARLDREGLSHETVRPE